VSLPTTLGALRASGSRPRSVRQEQRENLLLRLRSGEPLFQGMIGYDDTVIPAVQHALLAGHDLVFLGERGQGKSRMMRQLAALLDDALPILAGSEVNDDPLDPISAFGKRQVAELGDATPVAWIGREERYAEKLATPDVTIADLLGEIDPIKVAEGRYLADETTIHYGLIPRTNRGIFCINELPDLPERVQVGLFNVMEEQDFQVKGFKVRLPVDVMVVASANPEDYTRRGRIITPLKDRYQAQVRTHYPDVREVEIQIMKQEAKRALQPSVPVHVPDFVTDVVAELTLQARQSPDISQVSGVSVRASIANYQTLIAVAERRVLLLGQEGEEAVPRISDLAALASSTLGKLELEYGGGDATEDEIFERLLRRAIKVVFDEYVALDDLAPIVESFEEGWKVEVGSSLAARENLDGIENSHGLGQADERLVDAPYPAPPADAVEFVLEGRQLSGQLDRAVRGGGMLSR